MTERVLNFGLLSTAGINKNIIPAIRASPFAKLHSVCSRSLESAKAYAEKWEIPTAFGSYDELLDAKDVDVVYVPLPNHLHKEWTIKAMRKGKHVLCEKPMALTEEDIVEMYAVARECKVVLAEAFMWIHLTQSKKIQSMLHDEKAIGDLQYIRSAFTFTLAKDGHRSGPLIEGGGSIWDVGVYPLSFARFMFKEEPVEVYCKCTSNLDGSDADDSAHAMITFPGGKTLHLESSFRTPLRMTADIFGSEGSIVVPNAFKASAADTFSITRKDATVAEVVDSNEHLGHVYQGEVDYICQRAASLDAAEAFSVGNVKAVNALHKSWKENAPVKL